MSKNTREVKVRLKRDPLVEQAALKHAEVMRKMHFEDEDSSLSDSSSSEDDAKERIVLTDGGNVTLREDDILIGMYLLFTWY